MIMQWGNKAGLSFWRRRNILLASAAFLSPVAGHAQSGAATSSADNKDSTVAQQTSGAQVAQAQSAPASPSSKPQSSTAPAAQSGTALEPIVVTAQKRTQRFNDVGVTVNVVTGTDLKRAGIKSFVDVASQIPNVQMKNVEGNSITNVTIRGIGLNDYAVNNNPAAGIYVDNVYLVSPAMLTFSLFDVDRIEVLKGPQGDLYGRNTTAGAINVISRRPSSVTDVELTGGYGSYQSWHIDGAVGGALTSNLDGRFAFQTVQQDSGWQTNYVTGHRVGKINRNNGRLQLDWKPADNLSILFSGHLGYEDSQGMLYKVDNTLTPLDPAPKNPFISGAGNNPYQKLKSTGAAVTVDWGIAPRLSLTSITAYEHFTRINVSDVDGTALRQLDETEDGHIQQFSQEVRLNYNAKDLSLIAGAFYSHDQVHERDTYDAVDLLPALGLPGFDAIGNQFRQRTQSYAGFVHAEWTFLPRFTLVGGLRYTHEHKIFDQATTFLVANNVATDVFPPARDTFSTSKVSGKIGLNFKPADQTLIYASISRGFKSGGFQGELAFDPSGFAPFRDENLTAYEVGFKSRVLPNLQLNASVFDYEYHDAQFYGPLFDSPIGVLFGIANVGNARIKGAEGDVWWRPIQGLDIRAGIGAIDPKIVKSIVPGVTTGSTLPDAPKLTANGLIRYTWQLNNELRPDISLSGTYQSRIAFDVVRNPPEAIEPGYFLANAEVGLSVGDHWRVSVWCKNLFNKIYRTQALDTSVGWTQFYGPPRTVGLDVAYKI